DRKPVCVANLGRLAQNARARHRYASVHRKEALLALGNAYELVDVRLERDFDAPVLRLVRGRVVRRDGVEFAVACGRQEVGPEPAADEVADHDDGAFGRELPVRIELRRGDGDVVRVARDLE